MNPSSRYRLIKDSSPAPTSSWAVSYAGFIVLLLCFFILLCSYSVMDRSKLGQALHSFSTAVGSHSDVKNKEFAERESSQVESDTNNDDSDLLDLYRNVQAMANELGMGEAVKVSVHRKGIVLQLSDRIIFAAGQAELLAEAKTMIEYVGAIILNYPSYRLRIEGHTDNTPIRTSLYPSNWELSTSRAVNVARYLMDKQFISGDRLQAAGFGEYQPRFPNDTPENRAGNRRVELLFFRNEIKNVVQ